MILPVVADGRQHVFHIYAVRVGDRRHVMAALEEKGIACGVHYPLPIHLQTAYRSLGYKRGDFPMAEQCAKGFISLPMFPEMTAHQVAYVIDAVREACGMCATA